MYIITGGAGFIGSNILAGLEKAAYKDLVVVDWLGDGEKWRNISKRNLYDIIQPSNLFPYLSKHQTKIKAIIHMGAISATTETDADKIIENNFTLSKNLFQWCTENKTPLIYASSAATYGNGDQGFVDFEDPKSLSTLRPLNAYGWSKHLFDRWLIQQKEEKHPYPPQWVGLKFFNVYGSNEYHKGPQASVISHIYPVAKRKEAFSLFKSHRPDYKDGEQKRDFVWVGDCVNVVLWFLENPRQSGLFNVGSGTARTFKDLTLNVYKNLGLSPKIKYKPTPENIREKYQYFTESSMDKLKNAGYKKPFTSLEDGISQYIHSFLEKDDPYL